jgi:hypothetical protein
MLRAVGQYPKSRGQNSVLRDVGIQAVAVWLVIAAEHDNRLPRKRIRCPFRPAATRMNVAWKDHHISVDG